MQHRPRVADLGRWAEAKMTENISIGGMVAGGFDATGRYLLTVSHSGRGVFDASSWERVARDSSTAYPEAGFALGIGPLEGVAVRVREIDYATGVLELTSPDNTKRLRYFEGMLAIYAT
jgi:hypothetical protein